MKLKRVKLIHPAYRIKNIIQMHYNCVTCLEYLLSDWSEIEKGIPFPVADLFILIYSFIPFLLKKMLQKKLENVKRNLI